VAIKGKGKTKPRPAARAPRRMPVEVKPPWFRRRWVQVTTAFVVGVAAMVALVWVTNGLREQRAEDRAAERASERRAAATGYQRIVGTALAEVGTVTPGAGPVVLSELQATVERLAEGRVPDDALRVAEQAEEDAQAAAKILEDYDLVGRIADKGFDVAETNYFLNSKSKMVQALGLFDQAAGLAAAAASAEGSQVQALGRRAGRLRQTANEILTEGYQDYTQALFAAGVSDLSPGQGAAVPTGSS
jgi:hypothetical protein